MSTSTHQLEIFSAEVRLQAQGGDIVLLAGPVGSGKSRWLNQLAGLEPLPGQLQCTLDGKPWPDKKSRAVRMHFDQWPPIWLGQTVSEELCFGLPAQPAPAEQQDVLARWRLESLPLGQDTQRLNRLQAIRLSLAAMELAGPTLALVDNPIAALPEADAGAVIADMAAWAGRANVIMVVACNRWHSWQPLAKHVWHVRAGDTIPIVEARVD